MNDIYEYFDFDIGYLTVATEIVDSRYLTSVLAAAYGSFGLSDARVSSRVSQASSNFISDAR